MGDVHGSLGEGGVVWYYVSTDTLHTKQDLLFAV